MEPLLITAVLWGAIFYLLNKFGFSRAERNEGELARKWKIFAWTVYIIGLPGWLWYFEYRDNWIAFAVELGGLPAMILGLVATVRGIGRTPKFLDWFAALVAVVMGIVYSVHFFGGFTKFTQVCELGLAIGFLTGTYLLAKGRGSGYAWLMLMHVSTATFLYTQESAPETSTILSTLLPLQQLASIAFVVDAYAMYRRKLRRTAAEPHPI